MRICVVKLQRISEGTEEGGSKAGREREIPRRAVAGAARQALIVSAQGWSPGRFPRLRAMVMAPPSACVQPVAGRFATRGAWRELPGPRGGARSCQRGERSQPARGRVPDRMLLLQASGAWCVRRHGCRAPVGHAAEGTVRYAGEIGTARPDAGALSPRAHSAWCVGARGRSRGTAPCPRRAEGASGTGSRACDLISLSGSR